MTNTTHLAVLSTSMGDVIEKLLTASVLFLFFNSLVHILYIFLHRMLQMDTLWAQFIRTFLQIVVTVASLVVLVGSNTMTRLLQGFSIGFGYALQQPVVGAMNALYLRSEDKFVDSEVTIGGVTGNVVSAGLFHMKLRESKTGNIVYISNLKLTETVTKHRVPKARSDGPVFLESAPNYRRL